MTGKDIELHSYVHGAYLGTIRVLIQADGKYTASIRHATLAFGPPMLFCGLHDKYGSFQCAQIVTGILASLTAFVSYVVVFVDRMEKKRNGKVQGNKID